VLRIRKKDIKSLQKNNLRKSKRISLKATVIVRSFGNKIRAKGKCINASLEGIGLLFSYRAKKIFSFGDNLDILIIFPDNSKPIHKRGKIVWYKKNSILTYRSGIKFE